MTKAQKRLFAALKNAEQRAEFIEVIRSQQDLMGRFEHWSAAYRAKCERVSQEASEHP